MHVHPNLELPLTYCWSRLFKTLKKVFLQNAGTQASQHFHANPAAPPGLGLGFFVSQEKLEGWAVFEGCSVRSDICLYISDIRCIYKKWILC